MKETGLLECCNGGEWSFTLEADQGYNFTKFLRSGRGNMGEVAEVALQDFYVCDLFFSNSSLPMPC